MTHWRRRIQPQGGYYGALICTQGHVLSSLVDEMDERLTTKRCTGCGSNIINECPACKTPIRGQLYGSWVVYYEIPKFCHECSEPYPWFADRLSTARELLYLRDSGLTQEDRDRLWPLLQYVMSSPKVDVVVEAKKSLIFDALRGAATACKEPLFELLAKVIAEKTK